MATTSFDEDRMKGFEVPNISRNELREAAKLLPKLLLPTEEDDFQQLCTEEETLHEQERVKQQTDRTPVNEQRREKAVLSVEEDTVPVYTDKFHSLKDYKRSSKDSLTVPLSLSVFSLDNIPPAQTTATYHFTVIEQSNELKESKPVHSKDLKSTAQTTTVKESTVPKLPQIKAPVHSSTTQPIAHNNKPSSHHNSTSYIDKPNVPLQLQNIRHQLHEPLESTSKAIYPGMVGWNRGVTKKRIQSHPITIGHPMRTHHLSLSPTSGCIKPYSIPPLYTNREDTLQIPSIVSSPPPPPPPTSTLRQSPLTFEYLKKSSKKQVVFKRVSHEQNNEYMKYIEKEVVKKEDNPITEPLIEEEDNKSYLVGFNRGQMDEKSKTIINKFRGGVINQLSNLTEEVHNEYDDFMNEVDAVTYYVHRQAEELLQDYSPRIAMLISSAVPKPQLLQSATRPEVLSIVYDVATETYNSLLSKLKALLDSYMIGAKAKRLAVICKGGPGYMYLLQSKPITPPKLLKEEALLKFWRDVGSCMSKVSLEEQSVIHLMECNVAGNRQGAELLQNLEAAMYGHKVKAESPLELEPKGREMIATYFYPEKFKTWKSRRYTKMKLF